MRLLVISALVCILVSIGVFRFFSLSRSAKNEILEPQVGQKVTLEGLVVEEPDVRESSTRITVALNGGGKALLSTDHFPEFFYGDRVVIVGTLEKPENFETDTGREFNYVRYLEKEGIGYQMFRPQIEIISRGHGNFLKRWLLTTKRKFIANLELVIPAPHSSLAAGILLGAKHSLGEELEINFRKTGIIHLVVLSGYNITVVADFVMKILSFLPKTLNLFCGATGIILFAMITGGSATVVRASLMVILVLIAHRTGRTADAMRTLFIAAALMVAHNPFILLYDPSFQLSCMATFALITLSPAFERWFAFLPEKFQIRSCVASTLATQVFLLPTLIYMTGMVSIVSPIMNLLVLLVVPFTMLMSFFSGMVGFLSTALSSIFGFIAYMLLEYVLKLVEFFSRFSFASIEFPAISLPVVIVIYVVWIVGMIIKSTASKKSGENENATQQISVQSQNSLQSQTNLDS